MIPMHLFRLRQYQANDYGSFFDIFILQNPAFVNAMDLPFSNSYLESVGAPSFLKGCNFAAAGSTILPATATSVCPFSFGIQVAQFFHFKLRVTELLAKGMPIRLPLKP
ncbi:hypothetical protein M5K25_010685 [Dendrobium thyrsiflorum]|uniref:Uncharacterized protein n=1 Tax=Dendrobium thyrsiflorum TaxID=117978 RepID=A0ABD0V0Q7_DENTH